MANGDPMQVSINGRKLQCPFCGHDQFRQRDIKLNTAGMSFLGLDWANKAATGLICGQCGRIEMFMDPPQLAYHQP
ncbi:hypothetical protein [Streptomyces boncukensis]|uniref:DNA-binding protein n=1 Tax=Streptomyces boncukensis TaxID=2711219 RepID=A0A6G4X6M2_9ACTN|nr:hypothetical protein [Streptomyces boncukensis]NGO72903.1 hypothetical protein [Streptomyces boncukensis]